MLGKTPQPIVDAEFEVVRGPLRVGDRHPKHRGWRFLGVYDRHGDPLFYNKLHDFRFWMWLGEMAGRWFIALLLGGVALLAVIGWAAQRLGWLA